VAAWLTQNGLGADRVSTTGFGKKFPRVPNTSDANRALNRRVELVIAWGDGQVAKTAARTCPTAQACCELATLSGKGGAEPGCIGKEPGQTGWGADLGTHQLEENDGVLRLNPCAVTRSAAVWITSTDEDKIARLDEATGKEIFRVPTHGDYPQRTAVAADGSAWVTNRESGSYVHISGDGKLLCSSPMKTCVTRAAAIDSRGFAWIGCHDTSTLLQVSPEETDGTVELSFRDGTTETVPKCKELARVAVPGVYPYGLVADRNGGLWTASDGGHYIVKVDTARRAVALSVEPMEDPLLKAQPEACWATYGIAIDRQGNPWYANMSCGNVAKIDGRTGKMLGLFKGGPDGFQTPRALGVDRRGHVWVSSNTGHHVDELGPDGAFIKRVDVSSCGEGGPLGVATDSQGDMWVALQNAGKVMKFRTDGTILGCYPEQNFVNAYTYSDFTGAALDWVNSDRGVTRVRFTHEQAVRWRLASWNGLTPNRTGVCVRGRSAATAEALASAPWSADECPSTPKEGTVNVTLDGSKGAVRIPEGAVMELEFSLTSTDPGASPLLSGLSVAATRP